MPAESVGGPLVDKTNSFVAKLLLDHRAVRGQGLDAEALTCAEAMLGKLVGQSAPW